MTSCVIYGLALSKLIAGSIVIATRNTSEARTLSITVAVLALLLVLGIIFSTILISKLSVQTDSYIWLGLQYLNLAFSIASFVTLGGYGIRATESQE